MNFLRNIFILCALTSCTYSVYLTHTEGVATDVVDSTPTANADIKPNLVIPATAL